jgi:methyltransferase (TIGR00027 family)
MPIAEAEGIGRLAASTAEGAASLRAIGAHERDPAVRNPDHLAEHFISPGLKLTALVKVPGVRRLMPGVLERILPGGYCFEMARTRYMDDVVEHEVETGIAQLVILGAGFDSRAYRFEDLLGGVAIYEVDHPVTGRLKRERLQRIFGRVPPHVRFVQIDFAEQDLATVMDAHGYDREAATLFVWSGVAPYLPEEAVDAVLAFVAANGSAQSSIVFDYIFQEVLDGDHSYFGASELLARVAKGGEPLISGIPAGTSREWLGERGLVLESEMGPDDARPYLTRSDGSLLGEPYGFGGIVHARVAAGS